MRAVIQRVKFGSVTVEGKTISKIEQGLVIFLGVGPQDTKENAAALAKKIALLRIFSDDEGKMNRSVVDIQGETLVVSQFTLFANTRKGNRPSFVEAALPDHASPLVDCFADLLREQSVPTQTGIFGADMMVEIHNDGPVTIWMEM